MTDREKVIKGLECCRNYLDMGCEVSCYSEDCPYKGKWNCIPELCSNALNLLKEQEAKTVKGMLVVGGHLMGKCPKCYNVLNVQDHPVACGFCGQKVKWDA